VVSGADILMAARAEVKIVYAGNALKALVSDGTHVTACGIVNGVWWCECRPGWLRFKAGVEDVCGHLYLVGASKRGTGLSMPGDEATNWTAAELLAVGLCSPQCLLALGDSSCSCSCWCRWHGALRDAVVDARAHRTGDLTQEDRDALFTHIKRAEENVR
jgi:hypothetical protein